MKKNVVTKNNNNSILGNNLNKKQVNKTGITSNLTSLNSKKINNSSNSGKKSNLIYDDNFISLINELSKMINVLYKSNNTSFSTMKNILDTNDNKNEKQKIDKKIVSNSFNKIETSFNDFYSNVKTLFQRMKNYENNINNNKKEKNNNIFKSVDNNNKYNDSIENDFDTRNIQRTYKINKNNNTNEYNLVKINYQNIKNNKQSNRSTSLVNNNFSPKILNYKKQRLSKNNNKKNNISYNQNNSSIIYSQKNDYDNDIDNNLNLIIEENIQLKNKNILLEKKNDNLKNLINSSKNSSSCNIRVNKPTRLIMDTSLMLNDDLSIDKSFLINNNNSMSTTYRNKKDLNKSFSSMKNNYLLSLKLSNVNNNLNKKNEIIKLKNNPIKIKSIKESVKQLKEKFSQNKNTNYETRNNVSKNNTQGSLVGGAMYSTMEDDYKKNNNSALSPSQNKSLKHLNTLNNISLKRDNSCRNDNKIRVNSIDKVPYIELNYKNNNKEEDKLNYDKITVITNKDKRVYSPFRNNCENLKQQILGYENIDNSEKGVKTNKIKTSMDELSLENQKLIDEINKLKINKDEELYKKISRFEGQIILLTRKNNELIQKLNENNEGKKKLLNVIKGNEKKMNEYNDIVTK